MNVLVIGGTRYIGRLVVEKLLGRGDSVTVFSRGNTRPDWWDQIHHIAGDRKDRKDFGAKLKNKSFDAVIDTQAFQKEDVVSAVEIFEGHVGRYLFVSTISVYFDDKLDFFSHCPFKESDVDWSSLDYTYPENEDPYGVGKRHCEKWLFENSALPYTIMRIPAVMGWDDPTNRMWWWVQRALDGGGVILPMGEHAPIPTMYAGDIAQSYLAAIDTPAAANQVYHLVMDEIMMQERWVELIWTAAGHKSAVTRIPRAVVQKHKNLADYNPPLAGPIPRLPDITRIRRDLGLKSTPAETWIQTTVDWYRKHSAGLKNSRGYEHRREELVLAQAWQDRFNAFCTEF